MHERTDGLERGDSRAEFRSEKANLEPDGADLRLERADLRHERTDLRFERADLGPERAALRPERTGGGEAQTNEQTNKRMDKSPPAFYRTSSSSGPLPKKNKARYTATKVMCGRAGAVIN